MNEKFAEFLATLRKEKGLTQKQLADKLGVTNKAVSKWETGEAMPDTALLLPLAKEMGVTVDELLNCERKQDDGFFADDVKNEENAETEDKKESKRKVEFSDDENQRVTITDDGVVFEDGDKKVVVKDGHIVEGEEYTYRKSVLEKVGDLIGAIIFAGSIIAYLICGFVGIGAGWGLWALIPTAIFLKGVIDRLFALFDGQRKEYYAKNHEGKNYYIHEVKNLIFSLGLVSFMILGGFFGLWHPYWIILASCAIVGIVLDSLEKVIK